MTTFTIEFDFNSADQKAVLKELQTQGYNLLAYKGAVGPNQLTTGVPTWFAVPFGTMFGLVDIDYQPCTSCTSPPKVTSRPIRRFKCSRSPPRCHLAVRKPSIRTAPSFLAASPACPPTAWGCSIIALRVPRLLTVGLAGLVTTPRHPIPAVSGVFTLEPSGLDRDETTGKHPAGSRTAKPAVG